MLFEELASTWEKIEKTSSRLEMTNIFANLLKKAKREEIKPIIYLSEGLILPSHYGIEIGLGIQLMFEGLSYSTGYSKKEIERLFKEKGDIGEVAYSLILKKLQSTLFEKKLTVLEVYSSLFSLAKLTGKGSQETKLKQLSELLNFSSPLEAKYLTRFCVGLMRLGIGQPTILDAITQIKISEILNSLIGLDTQSQKILFKKVEILSDPISPSLELKVLTDFELEFLEGKRVYLLFDKNKKTPLLQISKVKETSEFYILIIDQFKKAIRTPIERAFNLCNDLGKIGELTLFDYQRIENFNIELFFPIRPALAERLSSPEEIIEKLGPCAADSKYDGFRLQIHKDREKVEIYSRKLEKVSAAFPEIVQAVIDLPVNRIIFEGEAMAFNPSEKKYYPFQMTIKRKRKYNVDEMSQKFPLHLFVFDLLYLEGVDYSRLPFEQRRKDLEKAIKESTNIFHSELKMVSSARELQNFFDNAIKNGMEGIIAKDLSAPYIAGAREFAWIKLKKSYGKLADNIDAIVIGYYLGKGQRVEFNFGGLLVAVKNQQTQKLETIAKIGSGFSEKEMVELEKILSGLKIQTKPKEVISNIKPDFWVEPKLVITITADEISHSPIHTAGFRDGKGFALRFPRMVAIRTDKSLEDITSTEEIEKLYFMQFNSKSKREVK